MLYLLGKVTDTDGGVIDEVVAENYDVSSSVS